MKNTKKNINDMFKNHRLFKPDEQRPLGINIFKHSIVLRHRALSFLVLPCSNAPPRCPGGVQLAPNPKTIRKPMQKPT